MTFLVCAMGYGQTVSVKEVVGKPTEIVDTLLDNACVQVSNASISSEESVAYFKKNGGAFPISEGIIIRSGKAKLTEGRYTGKDISSQINTNGDRDLERLNSKSGQSPEITDVAFLEFDFVPLSSNFNFNFLFASNEYGEWQCVSSDVFAFLLTDLITGETSNLAVIPETDIPVSVRTIKDNTYNASCQSDNPRLFSSYQVNDPSRSTINMRGYTHLMNASADIIPGRAYRIRLVIGDSNDSNYDSAIFLEAGSFSANVDLGPDRDLCQGDSFSITTGLDASLYAHSWTFNGKPVPNEDTNSLTVTAKGTYGVRVTKNGTSCLVTDEVVFSPLDVQEPADLKVCNDGGMVYSFDLTQNNEAALGIDDLEYDLKYYDSFLNLNNDKPLAAEKLKDYRSAGNQKIYIKLVNNFSSNSCETVYNFDLLVNEAVVAHQPSPLESCLIPGSLVNVDITQVKQEILGDQNGDDLQVTYYESSANASKALDTIANPSAVVIPENMRSRTIWARVQDLEMAECFAIVSFEVQLKDPPPVDELEDVVECIQYILPGLTNGNYFTQSGGTGKALFAGDVITETMVIYIFNGPDENGCTNESSFKVTIIEGYGIGEKYCGQFTVPSPPEGAFYTQPGGPLGSGVELPSGTVLTEDQTIYHYAEVNGEFCRDKAFNIIILPLPIVDEPADVVTCTAYKLPDLENGSYYTAPGGMGQKLRPGHIITASQDLYVFNKNTSTGCTNEHAFRVTILPNFEDIDACGSYILPIMEVGSYYTQPLGQGTEIPAGTELSVSQTLYFYAKSEAADNCTNNLSFKVKVTPIPEVSTLPDVLLCEEEVYVLPGIEKGDYFTEPNREGQQFFPGDVISETTTIYINNLELGCTNESSFIVEIRPFPEVENFTDIYSCSAYELPGLTHGKYFTEPGGKGTQYFAGDIIERTTTLFVYNTWQDLPGCYAENAFTIYVEGIDVGEFEDVLVCDEYVLPELAEGNYYTESGGRGKKLKAGQILTSSQRIYVFSSNGTRFICEDEASFDLTITYTPDLPVFQNIESCGSYTLPVLSQEEYNVSYHWETGGNSQISAGEMNFSSPGTYKVYVYATAKGNPECVDETSFEVTVYPLLDLHIKEGTVCRDPETGEVLSKASLTSGLDPNEFEVNWFLNGELVHTGVDFEASEAGEYIVETMKLQPEKGADCNYNPTSILVKESGVPVINASVTEPFAEVAVIRVSVNKGFGEYEFSLNGGEFQTSNEFYDVDSGAHLITVRGVTGNCGQAVLEVVVLKHPKYFTPNTDGFNETWSIPILQNHPEARISIFDRYGKLLKLMAPTDSWDGTYNGREMPSDDYWFRVNFELDGAPKEFKSHFTLRR